MILLFVEEPCLIEDNPKSLHLKRFHAKKIFGNCFIFPIHIISMRVTSLDSGSHSLRDAFIGSRIFVPVVTFSQYTAS
jgi:hypothetical protein